jgi:hypothetical protein
MDRVQSAAPEPQLAKVLGEAALEPAKRFASFRKTQLMPGLLSNASASVFARAGTSSSTTDRTSEPSGRGRR